MYLFLIPNHLVLVYNIIKLTIAEVVIYHHANLPQNPQDSVLLIQQESGEEPVEQPPSVLQALHAVPLLHQATIGKNFEEYLELEVYQVVKKSIGDEYI